MTNETKSFQIFRKFGEVKSIKVQVGDECLLIEDSPSFIKDITSKLIYTVKYQDGSSIRCKGNLVQELIDGKWHELN